MKTSGIKIKNEPNVYLYLKSCKSNTIILHLNNETHDSMTA